MPNPNSKLMDVASQAFSAAGGSPAEACRIFSNVVLAGRSVTGPACAYLPCAASPYLQCDARVQPVEYDFSRSNVAFARDGFAERAQNGQRVGVRSPMGTPHDRGVGDVLSKEGSQVGTVMFQFGLYPGLCAVGASLQSVRGADGHIQRRVGITQSRGEDVSWSQVRARDEPGYLRLRGVIAL